MEKLNEYLQTLLSTCGYELHLEPNKTPYVINASGETEVANTPLLGTQISTIIFPLIPAAVKQQLPNQTEIEFVHNHNLGSFNFLVKKSPTGFVVTIRPILSEEGSGRKAPAANFDMAENFAPATPDDQAENHEDPQKTASLNYFSEQPADQIPFNYETTASETEQDDCDDAYEIEVETGSSVFQSEFTASLSAAQGFEMPAPPMNFTLAEDFASVEEAFPPAHGRSAPPPAPASAATVSYSSDSSVQQRMDALFRKMADAGASDLHLCVSMPPMMRCDGKMKQLESGEGVFSPEVLKQLLTSIMPRKNIEEFDRRHDTDFAYEIEGLARFRANVFMDRKGMGGVFRIIPAKMLTAEELGLPPAVMDLCNLSKGLVVVTGPTGSGKSTTLCAMIDAINKTREDHIITIEDPIEFVHENQKCLINQREVNNHTSSFKDALRAALREDPDILLVGEMRDLETISIAIETAETGHLVFGTLHTTTAPSTVDRIIDQFPADRQQQIRVMLSESLRGVIAQTLLPKKGGGRIAALEILVITPAISNLIREGKTFQIASSMQTGKAQGMIMLNDSMIELVKKDLVEPRDAYIKAVDKAGFEALLKREGFKI